MQEKHGLDGWFETYCVDRAVTLAGGVIEKALHEREEVHTMKGTKWRSVYETVEDVFKALETNITPNGAAAFIAASKQTGAVVAYG